MLIPGDPPRRGVFAGISWTKRYGGWAVWTSWSATPVASRRTRSILDISNEQFDWTIKTNIYAPFWIIKASLPHMPVGSAIIATTSEQAYDPSANLYDYAQTKAATMNFVKSLAKQLGPKGIRVNGVAPGPIWTPLQVTGGATQEKIKDLRQQYAPGPRRSAPPSWRRSMFQLAASDASYANGQVYGSVRWGRSAVDALRSPPLSSRLVCFRSAAADQPLLFLFAAAASLFLTAFTAAIACWSAAFRRFAPVRALPVAFVFAALGAASRSARMRSKRTLAGS